jgi:hypothetical protein
MNGRKDLKDLRDRRDGERGSRRNKAEGSQKVVSLIHSLKIVA